MIDKKTIEQFDKMFDLIPSDDGEQAEEYGHSSKNEESFEELSKEVSSEIEDLEEKGLNITVKNPHDIVKKICSKDKTVMLTIDSIIDENTQEMEEKDRGEKEEEEDFDSLPQQDLKEVIQEEKEEEKEEEEKEEEEKGGGGVGENSFIENELQVSGDKITWFLTSSSEMYDSFYRQKKIFIERYVVGGQIEYSRWMQELEEAEVDVVTEVFDQHIIIKQMEDVQQHRNRVKYIGVRVNNQYYLFDRYIGMLRGYLARIQYLKPVLKQEGLILEHMGDIELYYTRLQALHDSAIKTEKNLAASYEMLSRKVTICMELPPVERYEKPSTYKSKFASNYVPANKVEDIKTDELDGFDALPKNAKAGPKKKITGKIGWGDI